MKQEEKKVEQLDECKKLKEFQTQQIVSWLKSRSVLSLVFARTYTCKHKQKHKRH